MNLHCQTLLEEKVKWHYTACWCPDSQHCFEANKCIKPEGEGDSFGIQLVWVVLPASLTNPAHLAQRQVNSKGKHTASR